MPALATGAGHEPGLYALLAALPSQLQPHVSRPEDNTFLQDMFGERGLHSLVKIHERLQHYEESKPAPVLDSASVLAQDLSEQLEIKSENGDIKELTKLLENPHVKSLLSVHDTVAQKRYDPELPPLPEDLDDEENSVKIIRLVKNKEPLLRVTGSQSVETGDCRFCGIQLASSNTSSCLASASTNQSVQLQGPAISHLSHWEPVDQMDFSLWDHNWKTFRAGAATASMNTDDMLNIITV